MTAKERLLALVEDLDDDQAEAWAGRLQVAADASSDVTSENEAEEPVVRQRMNRTAALALLKRWRAEPPLMTQTQWEEFAAAIDEGRQERPLFH